LVAERGQIASHLCGHTWVIKVPLVDAAQKTRTSP
jgi:hypothetical protein